MDVVARFDDDGFADSHELLHACGVLVGVGGEQCTILAVVRLRFQVHGRTGYAAQKVGLVDAVEPRAVIERLAEPHVEVVVEVQAAHPVVRHPGQREVRVGVR